MLLLEKEIVLGFDVTGISHYSKALSSSASFYLNPLLKKSLGREHQSPFTDMRTEAQTACRGWTDKHQTDHFSKHFPSGTLGQQNRKETLHPFPMINISNAPGWPGQI